MVFEDRGVELPPDEFVQPAVGTLGLRWIASRHVPCGRHAGPDRERPETQVGRKARGPVDRGQVAVPGVAPDRTFQETVQATSRGAFARRRNLGFVTGRPELGKGRETACGDSRNRLGQSPQAGGCRPLAPKALEPDPPEGTEDLKGPAGPAAHLGALEDHAVLAVEHAHTPLLEGCSDASIALAPVGREIPVPGDEFGPRLVNQLAQFLAGLAGSKREGVASLGELRPQALDGLA
jgi:hypothetical protein